MIGSLDMISDNDRFTITAEDGQFALFDEDRRIGRYDTVAAAMVQADEQEPHYTDVGC
jgi:hypothetical protein